MERQMHERFTAQERWIASHLAAQDRRIDERFEAVDRRFDQLRDELLAAFRGELMEAISSQGRHIIVASATAVFGIGGLAVTLAQRL